MVARDHTGDHGMVTALRCVNSLRCSSDRELCHGLNGLVPASETGHLGTGTDLYRLRVY